MDPAKQQQAPEAATTDTKEEVSLEAQLAQEFDRLERESAGDASPPEPEEHEPRAEGEAEPVSADSETPYEAGDVEFNEPAPERWPADIKKVYNELPPAAKKAMLEGIYKPMQATYTQTTQKLSEAQKRIAPMLEAFEAHRGVFEQSGVDPAEAFRQNVAWAAHFSRVGPEQGLKDMQAALARSGVIKGGQQENVDDDVYLTPTEKALKAKLDNLERYVQTGVPSRQELEQRATQEARAAQAQQVQATLAQFASETTPEGVPKHPHIERVAPAMAGLLRGGLVPRVDNYGHPVSPDQQLAAAYKLACEMDPEVRDQMSAPSRQRQAERITAASRDIPSKAPASTVNVQEGPLTDSIADVYDKLEARGARR